MAPGDCAVRLGDGYRCRDGAFPTKTYTFTPSAGSLTLTVTGTVQFAQQTGAFATSYIPTGAGQRDTRG